MRHLIAILLACAILGAGQAQAQQPYSAPACQALLPHPLTFDDRQHLLWYNRFWTGVCVQGLAWCQSGSPNWNEVMGRMSTQVAAPQRPALTTRLCALGQLVGREWARDNGIRKIDTRALRGFYATLNGNQGDAFARVGMVEQQARAMMSRPR